MQGGYFIITKPWEPIESIPKQIACFVNCLFEKSDFLRKIMYVHEKHVCFAYDFRKIWRFETLALFLRRKQIGFWMFLGLGEIRA